MTTPPLGDRAIGAFSDDGPWQVDPDALEWRLGLDLVREHAAREAARFAIAPRLPPLGRITRVLSVIGPALAIWYLRERRRGRTASRAGLSRRLRRCFTHLGPTYIKLGQILSAGEGIFPAELVAEFKLLRDQVPADSFARVRETVESDLGQPLETLFAEFDEIPVAAASIAQVHRARLVTGEEVVVKVQRPRVAELVRSDLAAMSYLAPRLVGRIPVAVLANPPALIALFADTIVEELDFRLEAENMLDIAAILVATEQRAIVVPRPHPRLVTPRVLVMERLDGFAWDDVEAMRAVGISTEAVLRAAVVSLLEGAMLHGAFHGDLHGGNMLVLADGRVGLLDFGITGRLDEARRVAFLRLVIGGTVNDYRAQVAALIELGAFPAHTDIDAIIAALGIGEAPKDVVKMSAEELTKELRELTRELLAYGAKIPKELMLFVKDILFLDGAVAAFAPDVDLLGEIASIAAYFAQRHGLRIASEIGLDPRSRPVDLTGVRASLGVDAATTSLSHRELQERRAIVRAKFSGGGGDALDPRPPGEEERAPRAPGGNERHRAPGQGAAVEELEGEELEGEELEGGRAD